MADQTACCSCYSKATLSLTALGLVFALLPSSAAFAQQEDGSENIAIEEIVTTALQRQQGVQDVPIAVSAFSADMLEKAGIADLRDLTQISPSLVLTSSQSETAGAVVRIRGIGTTGDNPGLESAVAIFIDGVYRNRTNTGLTELGAVERIEVLRGPQGTLFGRNASAGLISVTTKRPTFDFEGYASASYGNYDAVRLEGGLSGPLVENKLAARVDGVYFKRDGFMEDKVTGEDYNDRDRYLIRSQLEALPSEDLTLRLIFDYSKREEQCCAAVVAVPSAVSAAMTGVLGAEFGSGALPGESPYDRMSATSSGRGFQQDVEEWGLSLQADWDTGIGRLTSITAYRDWDAARSQDIDFTSLDIAYRDTDGFVQEFKTFSQEVRLNGKWDKLDWLVGAYFADEDLSLDDAIRFGSDFTGFANLLVDLADGIPGNGQTAGGAAWPGYDALTALVTGGAITTAFPEGAGVVQDSFSQNSRNWALFTHNIYSLTETMELSVGLRYTQERKKLDASVATNNPACLALIQAVQANPNLASLTRLPCAPFWSPLLDVEGSDRRKEKRLTGTAALNMYLTEDLSTYASYSRGYKGGGFNLDRAGMVQGAPATPQLQFEEEVVDSFELGAKYRSPGGSLILNTTFFYSDFSNFQLNAFDGASFVVVNLPKAETYGVEVESQWRPMTFLSLSGGLTYAHTEYGSSGFDGPNFEQPSATNPLGGAFWQLPGNRLTNAPRLSVSGGATWQQPVAESLEVMVHLDGRYTSKMNTGSDLDIEKVQSGYFLLNGKVGLGDIDGRWQVELWAATSSTRSMSRWPLMRPCRGPGQPEIRLRPAARSSTAFWAIPGPTV